MAQSSSSSTSSRRRVPATLGTMDLESYSLIKESYPVEWDYEGYPIICRCKMVVPRRTSWTAKNPGRRFYGCPNFQDKEKWCRFLIWHDPESCDYTKEIISRLKEREMALYDEATFWKHEAARLKENAVDFVEAELIVENAKLKNEVDVLSKKLKEKMKDNMKDNLKEIDGKNGKCWKFPILLCVIIVVWFYLLNEFKRKECSIYALP